MSSRHDVYSSAIITRSVPLDFTDVGNDIESVLAARVASEIEGRCIVEGFVRPGTVQIQGFSAGLLEGARVVYQVQAQCDVCCPVEGMEVDCVVKNVTKAGVRAEIAQDPSPMMIFLARDHHHRSNEFSKVRVGDTIHVSVIGQRFELNDSFVSVIATMPTKSSGSKAQ
jgi:hypothetical protein